MTRITMSNKLPMFGQALNRMSDWETGQLTGNTGALTFARQIDTEPVLPSFSTRLRHKERLHRKPG